MAPTYQSFRFSGRLAHTPQYWASSTFVSSHTVGTAEQKFHRLRLAQVVGRTVGQHLQRTFEHDIHCQLLAAGSQAIGRSKIGAKSFLVAFNIAPGVKSIGPRNMRVKGRVMLCCGFGFGAPLAPFQASDAFATDHIRPGAGHGGWLCPPWKSTSMCSLAASRASLDDRN